MWAYQRRKRGINKVDSDDNGDNNTLPPLPPTRPDKVWNIAITVQALGDRDPTQFSDPSIQLFYKTIKVVDIQL